MPRLPRQTGPEGHVLRPVEAATQPRIAGLRRRHMPPRETRRASPHPGRRLTRKERRRAASAWLCGSPCLLACTRCRKRDTARGAYGNRMSDAGTRSSDAAREKGRVTSPRSAEPLGAPRSTAEQRAAHGAMIVRVTPVDPTDITGLLRAWSRGDQGALEQLTPLVYAQLRLQARRYLRKEPPGVMLESTGLVHELYLRLTKAEHVDWQDRVHFFALCAQLMRRILVDAARARRAAKRGGTAERGEHASMDLDQVAASASNAGSLCALDDALEELRRNRPAASTGGRDAFLRGAERRRDGGRASGLAADGDARLAARESLARTRAARAVTVVICRTPSTRHLPTWRVSPGRWRRRYAR